GPFSPRDGYLGGDPHPDRGLPMTAAKTTPLARTLRKVLDGAKTQQLGDRDLLERYLTLRDESAFVALVRRHGPRVLAACRGVLTPAAEVEAASRAPSRGRRNRPKTLRWQDASGSGLSAAAPRAPARPRGQVLHRRKHEAKVPARPADADLSWREAC